MGEEGKIRFSDVGFLAFLFFFCCRCFFARRLIQEFKRYSEFLASCLDTTVDNTIL